MKYVIKFIFILIAFFLSCRERANMFDTGASDFIPPPAIFQAIADSAIYNQQMILIGVHFTINFIEEFEKEIDLHNVLYEFVDEDKIEITSFDITMNQGDTSYDRAVYALLDIGLYCLTVYFGGVPIGAATFAITDHEGVYCLQAIEDD
jgi:hypothetical protein